MTGNFRSDPISEEANPQRGLENLDSCMTQRTESKQGHLADSSTVLAAPAYPILQPFSDEADHQSTNQISLTSRSTMERPVQTEAKKLKLHPLQEVLLQKDN